MAHINEKKKKIVATNAEHISTKQFNKNSIRYKPNELYQQSWKNYATGPHYNEIA